MNVCLLLYMVFFNTLPHSSLSAHFYLPSAECLDSASIGKVNLTSHFWNNCETWQVFFFALSFSQIVSTVSLFYGLHVGFIPFITKLAGWNIYLTLPSMRRIWKVLPKLLRSCSALSYSFVQHPKYYPILKIRGLHSSEGTLLTQVWCLK